MKVTQAAVLESNAVERRKLVQAVTRAGVKARAVDDAAAIGRAGLVVIGPSIKDAAKIARTVRKAAPNAILLAAQKRLGKAAWADGVLPLPVSPNDLKVRLPELARWLSRPKAAPKPSPRDVAPPMARPGEGILDPLTSFYTFAHFKEVLFVEVKRARRYGFPLSMALIAFDPLPTPVGADLRTQLMGGLALAIRRSLRDTDYPVQYGPDRVLLLMPHTDLQGALVVSRRICERVGKASLSHEGKVLHPKVSLGVAATTANRPRGELSFADLVKHAQSSLEVAMAAGGDRVEFYDPAATEAEEGER